MTRSSKGVEGLPKMALHGDWPWHVALFKEDVHVCDGTLISSEWLVTTASCFQGQPKAEWTARFGTVRLSSSTPWEQERRIVGKVFPSFPSLLEGTVMGVIRRTVLLGASHRDQFYISAKSLDEIVGGKTAKL